jgi:hypothetical protein
VAEDVVSCGSKMSPLSDSKASNVRMLDYLLKLAV